MTLRARSQRRCDPALTGAARCARRHRMINRADEAARAAEARLAAFARAAGLKLTAAARSDHIDARALRRALSEGRRQRRQRDKAIAKLAATRATTDAGVRAKLIVALMMLNLDPHSSRLLRSATADLRISRSARSSSG